MDELQLRTSLKQVSQLLKPLRFLIPENKKPEPKLGFF
ncbi:hypothetical protein PPHE_a3829 [Pseudoalteromonas phenolica O-BC30]|nr:hypothetical protein [Pseudoalteromonas phenolica O-BC30]